MNHSNSFKITFGNNLNKRKNLDPKDFNHEEIPSKEMTSEAIDGSKFNSDALDRWMQLWSRSPHNPFSTNSCEG